MEAQSAGKPPFGIERALQIVRDHATDPSEIIDILREAICDYVGSRDLDDDVTMVLVKSENRIASHETRSAVGNR